MIRKLLVVLLACLMIFTLASCTVTINKGGISVSDDATKTQTSIEKGLFFPGDMELTGEVDSIDLEYSSGKVTFLVADQDGISIKETCDKELEDEYRVHSFLDGKTLKIRYVKPGFTSVFGTLKKELVITVPKDVCFDLIDISVSSANVDTSKLNAKKICVESSSGSIDLTQSGNSDEIELKSSSGSITLNLDKAKEVSVDTSSGKIRLYGNEAYELSCESSSGSIDATLNSDARKIDLETSSGNIKLTVPKDSNFTLDIEPHLDDFTYDIPLAKKGNQYVAGKGANEYEISTASGRIELIGK